jgi:hypothetical protein
MALPGICGTEGRNRYGMVVLYCEVYIRLSGISFAVGLMVLPISG